VTPDGGSPDSQENDVPSPSNRPRADADLLAYAASRLTDRDIALAELLLEHQVLTTDQIATAAFTSPITARHRLQQLYRIRIVDRFRPLRRAGSAPNHWVLDETGAAVLAAHRGTLPADLGYRRDRALNWAHNPRLAHLVGSNGVFTDLLGYGRTHAGTGLHTWWSERRCAHAVGSVVRPDGYGLWHDQNRTVAFYLEYDRGTETLHRVVSKLDGYARLAAAHGPTQVLIHVPTPAREAALRHLLAAHPQGRHAATTINGLHPAQTAWLPCHAKATRTPLAALPNYTQLERHSIDRPGETGTYAG
jgi:hypothetical protein